MKYFGTLGVSDDNNKFEALSNLSYLMDKNTTNPNAEPLFHLSCGFDFEAEMEGAVVDKATWKALIGSDLNDFTLTYDEIILVPARRHKKHRIQKKWIKRYGYKEVRVPRIINGVGIEQISDNEFMFVKENNNND